MLDGKRVWVVNVALVLAAAFTAAMCLIECTPSGHALGNEEIAAIRVGEVHNKCCKRLLLLPCKHDPALACGTNPTCNIQRHYGKCQDTPCHQMETQQCETTAKMYMMGVCLTTGNQIQGDCPAGEQHCEYSFFARGGTYDGCGATSDICIWAGRVCP